MYLCIDAHSFRVQITFSLSGKKTLIHIRGDLVTPGTKLSLYNCGFEHYALPLNPPYTYREDLLPPGIKSSLYYYRGDLVSGTLNINTGEIYFQAALNLGS